MGLYHSMRAEHGAEAARGLARKILEQKSGNVSVTSAILGCSRLCVRRAREGPLQDYDRTPAVQPRRTTVPLEQLILRERKTTGYGKRRLAHHLWNRHGVFVSEGTVRNILRRHCVKHNHARRSGKVSKPLYDYEALLPFQEGQVDTKWIEDYGALGSAVFVLRRYGLPLYQWTYVDAKTKTRFLAYSHNLGREYGWLFMGLVLTWLRSNGITTPVRFQADNGAEFCEGSARLEAELNNLLNPWQASFGSIPVGKKWRQGIVERSHRTDDEEFYRPHLDRIHCVNGFLLKAQRWQDTYNCLRQSWGKGMGGKTPLEKLQSSGTLCAEKLLHSPVVILDDLLRVVKGGNYLLAHYHYMSCMSHIHRVHFRICRTELVNILV